MKYCCRCNEQKPIDMFHKHLKRKDGLQDYCKQCKKGISSNYRKLNREKETERALQWRANNREKVREIYNKWRVNHPEYKGVKRAKAAEIRQKVGRCFAAQILGIKAEQVTDELLDIKRHQLAVTRMSREMNRALKQTNQEKAT